MIALALMVADPFGADSSPAALAAVRELMTDSVQICAPWMRGENISAALKARGYTVPGVSEKMASGPYIITYASFTKPNSSTRLGVRLRDGVIRECTLSTPHKIWFHFDGKMADFAKDSGLKLEKEKDGRDWIAGDMTVGSHVSGSGGTIFRMERE